MKTNIDKLIESNSTLVNTNAELAHVNKEAINLVKMNQEQRENLVDICLQIYEALSDKKELNFLEESWEKSLYQILFKKKKES